jgi:HAD superfamily hydrolase (TIGR01490 family)
LLTETGPISLPPPKPAKVAAYCDVDGTLTATTIVTPLLWFRRKRSALSDRFWISTLPLRAPWWLLLDHLSRGASNRAIYHGYKGMDAKWARDQAQLCFYDCIKPRLFPLALRRLQELRRQDIALVLVTGGLNFVLQPLADFLGAELIAPGLREKQGVFTGELDHSPLTGSAKYVAVCKHATHNGIDLAASYAFGDAYGDLNMLYSVGHPVAVNPEHRVRRVAVLRKWEIAEWKTAP